MNRVTANGVRVAAPGGRCPPVIEPLAGHSKQEASPALAVQKGVKFGPGLFGPSNSSFAMPTIQAFRGLRYDLGHIGSLSDVVTPPYDVISPEFQEELYKKHP